MGKSRINKKTSRKGMRSGRGLAASMLDKPIFHRLNQAEKMRVLELARMVDPDIFMKGGGMSKKKKGYAKGGAGFAKPHNYFAGGSVTNNLKSK